MGSEKKSSTGSPSDFGELPERLVNSAQIVVFLLDSDGKLVRCNAWAEEISGYSADEIVDRGLIDFFCQESSSSDFEKQMRWDGRVDRVQTKDGSLKMIEWIGMEALDNALKILAGRDITTQFAIETRLRDSEQRASAVMETAVNAIITMDESRLILSVNSAAVQMFGYAAEEMLGQNVKILMTSPDKEAHDEYVKSYVATGKKKIIGIGREVVGLHKDGTCFPVDLSVGEAQLQDGTRLFTGILRDLTVRKRLEEKILEISEEEQRRIGRDIHDDLCQQLAGIGCLTQGLQKRLSAEGNDAAEELAEVVQMVGDANARAREMARGLVPVIRESDGLFAALSELALRTQRLFGIECEFTNFKPVFLDDNKLGTQLFRIAQEAVSNACRHSQARLIDVMLRRDSDELVLSVTDNGKGISPGAESTKGLGLLTMEHRAKTLGGRLQVSTGPGRTEVCCRVPLERGEQ